MDRLNRLLGDVVISQGGVVPHIAAVRRSPLLFMYQLIICIQELLPSKSRYAAHLPHALPLLISLLFPAKEGKKRKRLNFSFPVVVSIIWSAMFSTTMLYIIIRLLRKMFGVILSYACQFNGREKKSRYY